VNDTTWRIAVTREEPGDGPLSSALAALGLRPVSCAAVEHTAPADAGPLERAASELEGYDWLVVSSTRAVEALRRARGPRPWPRNLRTAAVGDATAAALRAAGAESPMVAGTEGANALADELVRARSWRGLRVLLPRAEHGSPVLGEALRAAGARAEEVTAYRTRPRDASRLALAWRDAAPDAVVFASPSAVHAVVAAIGVEVLRGLAVIVAIGPTTSAALADHRMPHAVAAEAAFASAASEVLARLDVARATHLRPARIQGQGS
jgi:uroporphyrinogen-III synthase